MARNLIPSDATIKAIRQGEPRMRLSDGDGLLLLLFVKGGSRGWRFDYRIEGKRKMSSAVHIDPRTSARSGPEIQR